MPGKSGLAETADRFNSASPTGLSNTARAGLARRGRRLPTRAGGPATGGSWYNRTQAWRSARGDRLAAAWPICEWRNRGSSPAMNSSTLHIRRWKASKVGSAQPPPSCEMARDVFPRCPLLTSRFQIAVAHRSRCPSLPRRGQRFVDPGTRFTRIPPCLVGNDLTEERPPRPCPCRHAQRHPFLRIPSPLDVRSLMRIFLRSRHGPRR